MTREKFEQIHQYNGEKLHKIAKHLKDNSDSNLNYFQLPNGIILIEEADPYIIGTGMLYTSDNEFVGVTDKFSNINIMLSLRSIDE